MKATLIALLMASGSIAAAAPSCTPSAMSPFVVVDQFGYRPDMQKIAVIRSPVRGFDAKQPFAPGPVYQLVDAATCRVVLEGSIRPWNEGLEDRVSGDKVWYFDFSSTQASGKYFVRDKEKNVASAVFEVSADPYRQVLIQAVRTFYYQRANTPKVAPYAGIGWVDAADHVGPNQDGAARSALAKNDPSTARDLRGGWWDAGDYNRYTSWHSDYIVSLLSTYRENPAAFTDDFNIPESGNGIPDLVDEVKWGLDWLIRMQNPDGGMLSILGSGFSGAPPSSATNPSYYGPPSASASYSSAAAFAIGAKVLAKFPAYKVYAADLAKRAHRAWVWAEAHPDVTFYNKAAPFEVELLGGGEQEYSAGERPTRAMIAAIYLYDLAPDAKLEKRIAALAEQTPLMTRNQLQPADGAWLQPLMYYASLSAPGRALVDALQSHYIAGFSNGIYGAARRQESAYLAYLPTFYWGSNREISRTGFYFLKPGLDRMPGAPSDAGVYAAHYLHYLHGVNPLAKVYLSNMAAFGAENSVDSFFHAWFAKGTPWSSVRSSAYGPPPGYLVGGANPSYSWMKGCPQLNPGCGSAPPTPPYGQPPLKSYADINDGWPVASWEVSENSNGYQVEYIRLLAHFVAPPPK